MKEDVRMTINMAKEAMEKTIAHLGNTLGKIRAGKANPAMLDGIFIDYYGVQTPLQQASNINTLDAKTISIQPWDKGLLQEIEKAIMTANIGIAPQNNGEMIILNIPALTEERRKELVRQSHEEGEGSKVSIRNARKDANDTIKQLQNDGLGEDLAHDAEEDVQNLTNEYVKKIDELIVVKEKDIMTV